MWCICSHFLNTSTPPLSLSSPSLYLQIHSSADTLCEWFKYYYRVTFVDVWVRKWLAIAKAYFMWLWCTTIIIKVLPLAPTTHTSAFWKFDGKSLFAKQPLMSIQFLQILYTLILSLIQNFQILAVYIFWNSFWPARAEFTNIQWIKCKYYVIPLYMHA